MKRPIPSSSVADGMKWAFRGFSPKTFFLADARGTVVLITPMAGKQVIPCFTDEFDLTTTASHRPRLSFIYRMDGYLRHSTENKGKLYAG